MNASKSIEGIAELTVMPLDGLSEREVLNHRLTAMAVTLYGGLRFLYKSEVSFQFWGQVLDMASYHAYTTKKATYFTESYQKQQSYRTVEQSELDKTFLPILFPFLEAFNQFKRKDFLDECETFYSPHITPTAFNRGAQSQYKTGFHDPNELLPEQNFDTNDKVSEYIKDQNRYF